MIIRNILLVGLGGAVGAMMRYGITVLFIALHWSTNLGTCLTNVVGSFCMGLLLSMFSQSPWLLMATAGLCGGFTTFSTYSVQSVMLFQQGKYLPAALYIFGTVVLCIIFAAAGCLLGAKIK